MLFIACTRNYDSSCGDSKDNIIDENKLGFIDANVKSEETNLKEKAKYADMKPGESEMFERSFENAPPLIPHTTKGFFPVTIKNNACLDCHMPDKIAESGAREISPTHFANWRPKPQEIDGKYVIVNNEGLTNEKTGKLNNLYFNCSQCHVPQANVSVDIENLFTPEFREKHGLENHH
ncbi:MAG: nitrate reductase cytochrome c-type subunit; periplasmic nitrate reductase electron transfer subunit [Bacteroidetes bacterium]|nr:nitrate reductase cytochrome c-type subunit; periplasmic nitrate reductase electron transfer subunit [Bacteroidota bacterium]